MLISEQTLYSIVEKAKLYDELVKFEKHKIVCCSFCGKSQNEVKKIILGADNISICNECVEQCTEIIESEYKADKEPIE